MCYTIHNFFDENKLSQTITNRETGKILFDKYLDSIPKKEKQILKELITIDIFLDCLEGYFNPDFHLWTKSTTKRLFTVLQ